ncbi:MAG: hypothetical protein ABGY96_03285 [bacterium]|nr:hypothetical protein [Gammaproteobacteria bacterium]
MFSVNNSRLLMLVLFACGHLHAETEGTDISPLKLIGSTTHDAINEMSGLVKSKRFPNVYWVHNDSGDSPRLFAIDRTGRVIITDFLKDEFYGEAEKKGKASWPGIKILLAANQDWEDIAIDEDRIYIGDVGNNGNARRDMGVYTLFEPNPHAVHESRISSFIPIRYPEQHQYPALKWHYDSESMFMADGKLYFLTKHRQPNKHDSWEQGVHLYRLDSYNTTKTNVLTRVDSHEQLTLATGADLSPDGSRLAIVAYTALWVFEKPDQGDNWLSGKSKMLPLDYRITRQLEAVCWDDDDTLLISNEQREIYEVDLKDIPDSPKQP